MKLEKVTYQYEKNGRKILDNVTLNFSKEKINVVLGVNGAGKSTLFDLITGVIEPLEGFIEKYPQHQTCYQLQGFGFPPTFKGKDIVRLILNTDINAKYKSYGELLSSSLSPKDKEKLERLWTLPIGKMSSGERRWLVISTVCLLERRLYIFDEPTAGLDPEARKVVLSKIDSLINGDNTIIISTHILHDLENIDCKIFFLEGGKLKYEGDYKSLLQKYNADSPNIAFEKVINGRN